MIHWLSCPERHALNLIVTRRAHNLNCVFFSNDFKYTNQICIRVSCWSFCTIRLRWSFNNLQFCFSFFFQAWKRPVVYCSGNSNPNYRHFRLRRLRSSICTTFLSYTSKLIVIVLILGFTVFSSFVQARTSAFLVPIWSTMFFHPSLASILLSVSLPGVSSALLRRAREE